MAIPFLNHLDLRSVSELQNAILHKTTTASASNVEGKFIYDTGTNTLQYFNGSTWVNLDGAGDVSEIIAGDGLSGGGSSGSITLDAAVDDTTVELSASDGSGVIRAKTAAVADSGTALATGDQIYDFVTGQGYITGNETITLTGDVTGSGTTSIATTISAGAVDFAMINPDAIITEAEGIGNNDNDTTIPTSAAVKAYADSVIVGGLIYQGGYNAATNTPNLDSSPTLDIKKGWTYTVTNAGDFFTEEVEVGDVLIAEQDDPTTLDHWTTVQNNVGLADASTVGIGNVNAGTGISVAYANGTATVTNTVTNTDTQLATAAALIDVSVMAGNSTASFTHGLGSKNLIVQLYDTTNNDVVHADIEHTSNNAISIIFALTGTELVAEGIGDIRVVVIDAKNGLTDKTVSYS